jgi:hypothetical protein
MCAAPSKGCYTDITGASRDLCDDCVPPEDCMSVPDWVKLTYEEQQELCNKVLDCADSLCDGINKKEVCVGPFACALCWPTLTPSSPHRCFAAPHTATHCTTSIRCVCLRRARLPCVLFAGQRLTLIPSPPRCYAQGRAQQVVGSQDPSSRSPITVQVQGRL